MAASFVFFCGFCCLVVGCQFLVGGGGRVFLVERRADCRTALIIEESCPWANNGFAAFFQYHDDSSL